MQWQFIFSSKSWCSVVDFFTVPSLQWAGKMGMDAGWLPSGPWESSGSTAPGQPPDLSQWVIPWISCIEWRISMTFREEWCCLLSGMSCNGGSCDGLKRFELVLAWLTDVSGDFPKGYFGTVLHKSLKKKPVCFCIGHSPLVVSGIPEFADGGQRKDG